MSMQRTSPWNDKFFAAIRRGDDPFRAIDIADAWIGQMKALYTCIRCGWSGVRKSGKKPCPKCGGAVAKASEL